MYYKKATLIKGFDLRFICKTCHCLFLFEMPCRLRTLVSSYINLNKERAYIWEGLFFSLEDRWAYNWRDF